MARKSNLPIKRDESAVDDVFGRVASEAGYKLTVDLDKQAITNEQGLLLKFEVAPSRRHSMLHGLDDIALTRQREAKITAFETARQFQSKGRFLLHCVNASAADARSA